MTSTPARLCSVRLPCLPRRFLVLQGNMGTLTAQSSFNFAQHRCASVLHCGSAALTLPAHLSPADGAGLAVGQQPDGAGLAGGTMPAWRSQRRAREAVHTASDQMSDPSSSQQANNLPLGLLDGPDWTQRRARLLAAVCPDSPGEYSSAAHSAGFTCPCAHLPTHPLTWEERQQLGHGLEADAALFCAPRAADRCGTAASSCTARPDAHRHHQG